MILERFYDHQLAQASYLVACPGAGQAIVVDPNRNLGQYLNAAARHKVEIVAITETHIHADFVSGSRELAEVTGAQMYLSDEGDALWKYGFADQANVTLIKNGDEIRVGGIRLEAVHTPGHTPEHLSFVLTDESSSSEPLGAFTGDFLFVGDVGRPDLLERAAGFEGTMENGAKVLFQSLQKFLAGQPDHLMIWPAHGAGSPCGKSLGGVPDSVLAYEKRVNWGLKVATIDRFVEEVLAGQPEPPKYFKEMKRINKTGPDLMMGKGLPPRFAGEKALLEAGSALVIDLRSASESMAGTWPGAIRLPMVPGFLMWAGAVLPFDQDLILLGSEEQVKEAHANLRLIGFDLVRGWMGTDALRALVAREGELSALPQADGITAMSRFRTGQAQILDVRGRVEHDATSIEGAKHIPLGELTRRMEELNPSLPVFVTCAGGSRSPIAASFLQRAGFQEVVNIPEGIQELISATDVRKGALI